MPDHPHERGLIAAILTAPDTLHQIKITGLHFHDQGLGNLFDAITLLADRGIHVGDMLSLVPELRHMRHLDPELSSGVFLGELLRETFEARNAAYYADSIHRSWLLRQIIDKASRAAEDASRPDADPQAIIRRLESNLLVTASAETHKPQHVGDLARQVLREIDAADESSRGILTGIPEHDIACGGWTRGELITLAARPGEGKTVLACQVALHQAEQGRPAAIVSLEMQGSEIAKRMLSSRATVNSRRFRRGVITSQQRHDLQEAADAMTEIPLCLWDPPRASAAQIRSFAKWCQVSQGLELLVVDYCGLVSPRDQRLRRHEQIAEITAAFKALAKELQIPVLLVAQLTREADKGGAPALSWLAESASLERDSDIVMFLNREDDNRSELTIAKSRNGPRCKITMTFEREYSRFGEYALEAKDHHNYRDEFADYA